MKLDTKEHRPPLKVLHVFDRMNRGGAEIRTVELLESRHNVAIEFHFALLSREPGELDARIVAHGGVLHYCSLGIPMVRSFDRVLSEIQPDVVHSHLHYLSGLFVMRAARAGVPVRIAHFRSMSDGRQLTVKRRVQLWLLRRWIDKHATHIVGVSHGAIDASWLRFKPGDPRASVIYNGFSDELGAASVYHQHADTLLCAKGGPWLVHVGRFAPPKNHTKLLSVFRHVHEANPDTKLVLVGNGKPSREAEIRDLVEDLDLTDSVIFAGLREDVGEILQRADLLLFPSLWEGLPGAVIESCIVGTPVVASELPGTIEIQQYFGPLLRLVPLNKSDEDWAEVVLETLLGNRKDPEKGKLLFSRSPFTMERSASDITAIWRSGDE